MTIYLTNRASATSAAHAKKVDAFSSEYFQTKPASAVRSPRTFGPQPNAKTRARFGRAVTTEAMKRPCEPMFPNTPGTSSGDPRFPTNLCVDPVYPAGVFNTDTLGGSRPKMSLGIPYPEEESREDFVRRAG
jgi:hypothetical protein